MAKTLKCNVTFPLTLIVNSESVASVEESRKEAREVLASGVALSGERKAMIEAFASERTTEELLELILRKGLREIIRSELKSEMNNSETKVRIGDIKVDFEAPLREPKCADCLEEDCVGVH